MEEAENLCDYIVIMDKGAILKEGTLDQLLEEETSEKVVEFTTESNIRNSDFESLSCLSHSDQERHRKKGL